MIPCIDEKVVVLEMLEASAVAEGGKVLGHCRGGNVLELRRNMLEMTHGVSENIG